MLKEYIEKMWWKGQDPDSRVWQAEDTAVKEMEDFPFYFNIAIGPSSEERNKVNAEAVRENFKKEVVPYWKDLDETQKLICALDWDVVFFRAFEEIATYPKGLKDGAGCNYMDGLGIREKWQKNLEAWNKKGADANPSFDAWLKEQEEAVVSPQLSLWKKARTSYHIKRAVKGTVRGVILAAIIFCVGSYGIGIGPVAERFDHVRPLLVSADSIDPSELTAQLPVADFNASSIADGFTDRALMDGDIRTAWAEGEKDSGTDKRIYINIDKTQYLHYIVIYNGNQGSDEDYKAYNRLKKVTLRINNKRNNYSIHLKDTEGPQYIKVDRDVDRFWIILDTVYKGDNGENMTCVSEVEVY